MKKLFLPIVALMSLVMFSCGSSTANVEVDPGYNDLVVTIDGEEVAGMEYGYGTIIELEKGAHDVVATDEAGDVFFEGSVDVTGDGIMNLTGQRYVLWTDIYADNYYAYSSNLDIAEHDLIEDVVVEADLTFFEGNFIAEDWDYDLDTEWPEEVEIYGDYTTKSKIYREEDFVWEAYDWGLVIAD
ncbi:MAG: hypothetical protein ACPG4Z_01225 [Chitinophagales bacterium]